MTMAKKRQSGPRWANYEKLHPFPSLSGGTQVGVGEVNPLVHPFRRVRRAG